ncbi:hypothetical protein QVD17_13741 [Tagetes erecta]|uniref:Uncharacterized protein n=1 Tax=Tagetes erecta TaxID=13708 RepID=A0AAD8P3F7_TARER|nr:hypothetical protein QVD17_13741 [Tagetes erecta]
METFMEEFQHLKIQLDDIKSATNNFDDNKVIGVGGFGKVYGGEISHFKGRSMVAFKRLDRRFGQGDPEFWKEVMMLSRYTHANLISLLGFCDEDGEKILVYEHASNGSFDRHLSSPTFPWIQRLKICLDAARGLSYLHDDKGTQQRVLHRDIKSSNILLDRYWNAKVSDMGLSKIGPANQLHTLLVTNVVGTIGYVDPMYMELGILTKESDVYSFGVVLFEVLCGRLCIENSNGMFSCLVHMWKQKYKDKKLDDIIFRDPMQEINPRSLEIFSSIAFQCLHKSRDERPTMSVVVQKLETALDFQINGGKTHQESLVGINRNKNQSGMDSGSNASSSDEKTKNSTAEDEEDSRPSLTNIGNGPPEYIVDWTQENSTPASQKTKNPEFSRKYWQLVQHQNGLRIFEEILEVDLLPKSCSKAMKAVGVVEASCEEVFEVVMSMDGSRFEWDCSFHYGSLVEEVDSNTEIIYHRLQLDWFPTFVWPRDLCYARYWRRNDDGSYDVLFCSREHENCGPQPGHVRAHIESGGFKISPLKSGNGRPRSLVQHLMQIDLKGWGVRYVSSFQQHCVLQILKNVAGLREYFAQTGGSIAPKIPNMVSANKSRKFHLTSVFDLDHRSQLMDEFSDEDEDFQISDEEEYAIE